MKNNFVHSLTSMALLVALPAFLLAQGNPARGVPYFPGSKTFNNVVGAFTSSHESCVISASQDLDGENLEYLVFTKTKRSADWVLTDSGTIQEAGYSLPLCFPNTKQIMVILSCRQKHGGSVRFDSKKCNK